MSEGGPRHLLTQYQGYQPPGIPLDFPGRENVFVLLDCILRCGSFRRLIDCNGVGYVLLLELNKDVPDCLENDFLGKICEAMKTSDRKSITQISEEYMKIFWTYLRDNYTLRLESGTCVKRMNLLGDGRIESHKIQLITINGKVCSVEHTLDFGGADHFENPFPELKSYAHSQVEILKRISERVFKVRIDDEEYCLKTTGSLRKSLLYEMKKLHAACGHPSVVSLSGVIVGNTGKVIAFLMPFISGTILLSVKSATAFQKILWKARIAEAVKHLHEKDVVWGDANRGNVIINSKDDEPVLIDFEDACSRRVDPDLRGTKQGDLQMLDALYSFIENRPNCLR